MTHLSEVLTVANPTETRPDFLKAAAGGCCCCCCRAACTIKESRRLSSFSFFPLNALKKRKVKMLKLHVKSSLTHFSWQGAPSMLLPLSMASFDQPSFEPSQRQMRILPYFAAYQRSFPVLNRQNHKNTYRGFNINDYFTLMESRKLNPGFPAIPGPPAGGFSNSFPAVDRVGGGGGGTEAVAG